MFIRVLWYCSHTNKNKRNLSLYDIVCIGHVLKTNFSNNTVIIFVLYIFYISYDYKIPDRPRLGQILIYCETEKKKMKLFSHYPRYIFAMYTLFLFYITFHCAYNDFSVSIIFYIGDKPTTCELRFRDRVFDILGTNILRSEFIKQNYHYGSFGNGPTPSSVKHKKLSSRTYHIQL